jgi:hypothetical protein
LEALYYITKGKKTVGPCTLDDLHGYIAYGSVRDSDLVRREGATEWTPLRQLEELQLDASHTATARNNTTRRRLARYRDYARVPPSQRSGIVKKRLLLGFFLFPPLLWRGSTAVFQDRVYSEKKDSKGYLLFWPKWCELLVTVLLVINSLVWTVLLWRVWQGSSGFFAEISESVAQGFEGLGG